MAYRIPTTPDLILLSLQQNLINVLEGNSNNIYVTTMPDLNLLIPTIPYYLTIFDTNDTKIINEETVDPYTIDADTGYLYNYPDVEMTIWITLWLYMGSVQAQRLVGQINETSSALYPLQAGIMQACNLFDPTDEDGNLLLSKPIRFANRSSSVEDVEKTNSYWSKTRFTYTAQFIWDLTYNVNPPPVNGAFNSAYSSAFDT